jgi:inorganic phosphate transporter, PiT family
MLFLIFVSSGLFLGWSLGANDAANIFGSAVGTKMVSFIKAAWVASIFVILGAVFQGRGASETLNSLGAVNTLAGAFTVSLCSGLIVFFMTRRSLPVSTSQAIVGAIVGWSTFTGNPTDYSVLGKIFTTWITGPLLGMLFAAVLFILLRKYLKRTRIHVMHLDFYIRNALLLVGAFGAYSLGANNIANVMGVFVNSAPAIELDFGLFTLDGIQILFLLGGLAISAGIFTYSKPVMEKVGNGILSLTPEAAIVVVLSQSLVLFLFSSRALASFLNSWGLPSLPMVPVSSTQLVIGALLGIGIVKGINDLKFSALGAVAMGWVLTPISSGVLTFFSLFFVKNVFGLQVDTITPADQPAIEDLSEPVIRTFDMILPGLLVVSVLIIIVLTYLYFRQQKLRLKTQNELLSKQNEIFTSQKVLKDLEINAIQTYNTSLFSELELKKRDYNNVLLNITEQQEFLKFISDEMNKLIGTEDLNMRDQKLRELSVILQNRMSNNREVNEFYGKIEEVHAGFSHRLRENYKDLSKSEIRIAILIRLNMSIKDIASLMNRTPKRVESELKQLKEKLKIDSDVSLMEFLKNIEN